MFTFNCIQEWEYQMRPGNPRPRPCWLCGCCSARADTSRPAALLSVSVLPGAEPCFVPVVYSSVQRCVLVGSLEESERSERRRLPRICTPWGFGGHQRKYPQLQWRRGWGTGRSKDHCVPLQLRGAWWLTMLMKICFMFCLYKRGPLPSFRCSIAATGRWIIWRGHVHKGACFLSRNRCLSVFNVS